MTAPLLEALRARGLRFGIDGGLLKAGPWQLLDAHTTNLICDNKAALVAALRQEQAEDAAESAEERIAITGRDGGPAHPEAGRPSPRRASIRFRLHDLYGDPPRHGGGFLLGEPGDTHESLLAGLQARYGGRLASATES